MTRSSLFPRVVDEEQLMEALKGRWTPARRAPGLNGRVDEALGPPASYALLPGGSLLRPRLLLTTMAACGADPTQGLLAAVGAESGHVASLVHDDIIDNDPMRRGRPSVWGTFGRDVALVTGDALLFDTFESLASCVDSGLQAVNVLAAVKAVAECGKQLCAGEILESQLTARADLCPDNYAAMVRLKTGALFRGACLVGALLAGADESTIEGLDAYSLALGELFQVVDDVLPFLYTAEDLGKPVESDRQNKRVTFPILTAMDLLGESDRARLHSAWQATGSEPANAVVYQELVHGSGAIDASLVHARRLAHIATKHVCRVLPPSEARDQLVDIPERVAAAPRPDIARDRG